MLDLIVVVTMNIRQTADRKTITDSPWNRHPASANRAHRREVSIRKPRMSVINEAVVDESNSLGWGIGPTQTSSQDAAQMAAMSSIAVYYSLWPRWMAQNYCARWLFAVLNGIGHRQSGRNSKRGPSWLSHQHNPTATRALPHLTARPANPSRRLSRRCGGISCPSRTPSMSA